MNVTLETPAIIEAVRSYLTQAFKADVTSITLKSVTATVDVTCNGVLLTISRVEIVRAIQQHMAFRMGVKPEAVRVRLAISVDGGKLRALVTFP
jgi:hypothetical protein